MTIDYPDWTRLIQLIGTNIMLPIDIQGSFIMLPMDIQGANITLDINIKAADATVNIAINAENVTGNIAVEILAHNIENLTIDINAQHVGMYLQGDWAAKESSDVDVYESADEQGELASIYASYTPTGTSLLLVTTVFARGYAFTDTERDLNQNIGLYVEDAFDGKVKADTAGWGGCFISLSKPIRIPTNHEVRAYVVNLTHHAMNLAVSLHGFEIPTPP